MPTIFAKLSVRNPKAIQSRYGPGISSTDLIHRSLSASSQDAPELSGIPNYTAEQSSHSQQQQQQSPQKVLQSGSNVRSERLATKSSAQVPRQIADDSERQYEEFGAIPSRSTPHQHGSLTTNSRKRNENAGRLHKTLPSHPITPKGSTLLSQGGKSSVKTGSEVASSVLQADDRSALLQPPVYGYTTIGWDKHMDVPKAAELVLMCGEQIRMRGLDSPLIFSSMALDLSLHKVTLLLRSYLVTPKEFFSTETKFANPHDMAAVIKWSLARLGRVFAVPVPSVEQSLARKGVEAQDEHIFMRQRGFLEWDSYIAWSVYERNALYPVTAFSTFLDGLSSSTAALLVALFSLLSSTTSYSSRNGMTPSRLARLFGALVFGLPEDETFEKTYDSYIKVSNATEHLLLAYIRDMSSMEPLPTRLAEHVRGYPDTLAHDPSRPGRSVRGVPFTLISRAVRLYSVDLLQQSRSLPLDGNVSPEWAACCRSADAGGDAQPQFSDRYRKLLNLRTVRKNAAQSHAGTAVGGDSVSLADTWKHANGEAEQHHWSIRRPSDALESFSSLADQAWDDFMAGGFERSENEKLTFDLHESERKARMQSRQPVPWSQFEQSGFGIGHDGLESVLAFDNLLEEDVKRWPEERAEILEKLRKTSKDIPTFTYDTTPRVISSPTMSGSPDGQWDVKPYSRMDDTFPEVFADILMGNGWSNRDELTHRNANFVVAQYKRQLSTSEGDGSTDAAWFVIEEVVPAPYRSDLEAAGRRKNRSRASMRNFSMFRRRKDQTATATGTGGDSFFDEVFRPGLGVSMKKTTASSAPHDAVELTRHDSQSSTIRGPAASQQPDEGQFMSSSVRLLNSLKGRASKRLRKATRDDDAPSSPPPLPPKNTGSGMQQSSSWTSDDFETRSLHDPEIDIFAGPADSRRARWLKAAATLTTTTTPSMAAASSKKEKRQSKDDTWLDVVVRNNEQRPVTADDALPIASDTTAAADAEFSNRRGKEQSPSIIAAAGWSREDAPVRRTAKRDASKVQKAEAKRDAEDAILDRGSSPAHLANAMQSKALSSPHDVTQKNTPDRSSSNKNNTASPTTHSTPTEEMHGQAQDGWPAARLKATGIEEQGKKKSEIPGNDADDDDESSPSSLAYLRALPPRGSSSDGDRERAREDRIQAAKERARELRATLNASAMDDLERRREDRARSPTVQDALTPSSKAATTNFKAATLQTVNPSMTANPTESGSKPAEQSTGSGAVAKTSVSPSSNVRIDNPFAKDRFSGRVANLTSKFGGTPAKPITPQSTGSDAASPTHKSGVLNADRPDVSTLRRSLSPVSPPLKSPSFTATAAGSGGGGGSDGGVLRPSNTSNAVSTQPSDAGVAARYQKDSSGSDRHSLSDAWAVSQPTSASVTLLADPGERGLRHPFDTSTAGLNTDTVYPDETASNSLRDEPPNDDVAGEHQEASAATLPGGSSSLAVQKNVGGTVTYPPHSTVPDSVEGQVSGPTSNAGGRSTVLPPEFRQRYQPGMPLSNVEEERESVLSGSNNT